MRLRVENNPVWANITPGALKRMKEVSDSVAGAMLEIAKNDSRFLLLSASWLNIESRPRINCNEAISRIKIPIGRLSEPEHKNNASLKYRSYWETEMLTIAAQKFAALLQSSIKIEGDVEGKLTDVSDKYTVRVITFSNEQWEIRLEQTGHISESGLIYPGIVKISWR